MRLRLFFCGIGLFASVVASAENAGKWNASKTAWGHPDLQGIWTSDDLHDVPMERPAQYGTRRFMTEDELAQRSQSVQKQLSTVETGERPKDGFWAKQSGVDAAAVPANWVEFARRASRLTSLVAAPDNGRMPALTEEGKQRRAAQPGYFNMNPASWEDSTMYDRCISRGVTGSYFPSIYGNGSQIIQTPTAVAIRYEMIHETRIIPLDGRLHDGSQMRTYMGDPRGHWEDNTLVVETTNFTDRSPFWGSGDNLQLVERFTRTAPDLIMYHATIEDSTVYARPWTIEIPLTKKDEKANQIYESACHEGNYGLTGILSGARVKEREAAAAAKKK